MVLLQNRFLTSLLVLLFVLAGSSVVKSQSVIMSHFDLVREASNPKVDSSKIAFSSTVKYKTGNEGDYYQLLPVYSFTSANTKYAYGFNDGYLWQGKGLNQAFSVGVQGRTGGFEYTLAPVLVYSQNRSYELRSDYGTRPMYQDRFTNGIDFVQQYGDDRVFGVYLGQSEIAYSLRNVRLSVNTQNSYWGPAIFNQGLMSINANGFPNVRVGNHDPWSTGLGKFEMQWVFGLAKESDYFNNDSKDDKRIYNGFTFGYSPSFFEGLSLSVHRAMQIYEEDREGALDYIVLLTDFFRTDQENSDGTITERADQMVSIGFDWKSRSDNFRVYLEWIRGDFASDIMDFLTQPDHNAGYIWGFVKSFELESQSTIKLVFENSNLATWETKQVRAGPSLYTHGKLTQGYTNNGQVMGAHIGPGSSNHSINVSYNNQNLELIFEYYRTRYNDDLFYYTLYKTLGNYQDIQHYLSLGIKNRFRNVEYQLNTGIGIRDNYLFQNDEVRVNVHPQLILRYYFE